MQSNLSRSLRDYLKAYEDMADVNKQKEENKITGGVEGQINYINGTFLGSKIDFSTVKDEKEAQRLMMLLLTQSFSNLVVLIGTAGIEQKTKLEVILKEAAKKFKDFLQKGSAVDADPDTDAPDEELEEATETSYNKVAKVPDTKENAIQALISSGEVGGIKRLKIKSATPDPKFEGVWLLKQNKDDDSGWIVSLAGYPDQYGKTRTENDVYGVSLNR